MNASNPYEPPPAPTNSSSWRPMVFIVAGLWIAIPVGLFVGRRLLVSVFDEFGVALPAAAQILLRPYSPLPFTVTSLGVLITIVSIPHGNARHRFIWIACVLGALIGMACLLVLLIPLFSLLQSLM